MDVDRLLVKKMTDRAERRFEELKIDPQKFMARFDQNGDGVLDVKEHAAAIATLTHDLLRETKVAKNILGESIPAETLLIGRFRIVSEIGNGAQGITYAARDKTNGELVVVKQLRLSHIDAWDAYDSFRREIDILQTISHPKLPELIDAFEVKRDGGHSYFAVQELLPGRNLEDLLQSGELFTETDLRSIALQVLKVLGFLHGHEPSILHRDIKPSNLLLDGEDVYLVDFGAVQYADVSKTLAIGTAGYMPPEQLAGAAVRQSDFYGLGATLIRLATRTSPQDLPINRMRLQWANRASLTSGFGKWIDKMIDPEVEDRFRTAEVALNFLQDTGSVFVRDESPVEAKFSLEPVEVLSGRPDGSSVQLWESVDAVICTFSDAKRTTSNSIFGKIGALVSDLFSTAYKDLATRGGGFSLSADKKLQVHTHANEKFGYSLFGGRIEKIGLEDRADGVFTLSGSYTSRNGKTSTTHTVICFVSNSRSERDWVLDKVMRFSRDHTLGLI